jgi:hypothetical protein
VKFKLPWQKQDGTSEEVEASLSKEDQERLDKAIAASAELPEIKNRLAGLDSVNAYIEEQKQEKAAKLRQQQQQQQTEHAQSTDDEVAALMLTDPAAAVRKASEASNVAILTLRADALKRDTFEDVEKYQYYTGEVKSEVDKLLAGQTIAARNDIGVIENCYYTVVGRLQEANRDKKLKSRFASSGGALGDGGHAGGSSGNEPEITDDIRRVAKSLGFDAKEYAEMLQKDGVI